MLLNRRFWERMVESAVLRFGLVALVMSLWVNVSADAIDYDALEIGDRVDEVEGYEYKPMFVDGREWYVIHGGYAPYQQNVFHTHQILKVAVDGEEEIDGILCKRLKVESQISDEFKEIRADLLQIYDHVECCTENQDPVAYYYVYEKDRTLYVYRNPGPYYVILNEDDIFWEWQYELRFGDPYFDTYMHFNYEKNDFYVPMLDSIDDVYYEKYEDGMHRTIEMEVSHRPLILEGKVKWIEGIGCNCLENLYEHFIKQYESSKRVRYTSTSCLVYVTQDGVPIYDIRNKLDEAGIVYEFDTSGVSASAEEFPEDSYYNLQGLKVTNPRKGEIYIHKGKKILY